MNLRKRDEPRGVARRAPHLQFVHIPVANDRPPNLEQVTQWLEVCGQASSEKPVFVHCNGGEGRTSTFCALVRLIQGWDYSATIEEQRQFNFAPEKEHEKQAQFLAAFARLVRYLR